MIFKTEKQWLDFAIKKIVGKEIPKVSSGSGYLGNDLEIFIHGKKLGNNEPDLMVEGNPYEMKAFKGNNIIHIARTKIDSKSKNANVDHAKWAIDKMKNLILFKFQERYDNNPKKGLRLVSICNEIEMYNGLIWQNLLKHMKSRIARGGTKIESTITIDKLNECYKFKRHTTNPMFEQNYKSMPNIFQNFGFNF